MIPYLDYDGVLHPAEDILLDGDGKPYLQHPDPCTRLFMHAPILDELLAPYPELKIVLSTSWSYQFGTEGAAAYLPEGLRSRVIDKISHSMLPRGVLIARHAAEHLAGQEWLAVDDTIRMWPSEHLHRLVQCDSEHGLGCQDTQRKLRQKLLLMMTAGSIKNLFFPMFKKNYDSP